MGSQAKVFRQISMRVLMGVSSLAGVEVNNWDDELF